MQASTTRPALCILRQVSAWEVRWRTEIRRCVLGSVLGLIAAGPVASQQSQATLDALNRATQAVVGLQVKVAEGASSARTLGQSRTGSGVVIGVDGLILTIGYLILEADEVSVQLSDDRAVPARVVAYDLASGFGLVRALVPLRGVEPVALGSQEALRTGQPLMAVTGGAQGDIAMTQLVSKRAFSGFWEYHIDSALFTSPPLNASGGNHSGAPLFDERGQLVGIGSLLVMNAAGGNARLPGNMFVPVDLLKPILSELEQNGSSRGSHRPWLGLSSSDSGGRIQVERINPDSPAMAAGIAVGDLLLAVDGVTVTTLEAFYKQLWSRAAPDTEVNLTVLQGATLRTLRVKPVDRMSTLRKGAGV